LVLRIHPDLMECLTGLAADSGITRSMLVERAMVTFVNLSTGNPILDSMGRRLRGQGEAGHVLGTPESFAQIWQRIGGGGSVNPIPPQPPSWVRPDNPRDGTDVDDAGEPFQDSRFRKPTQK
jgi:predicted transcriptional regulator